MGSHIAFRIMAFNRYDLNDEKLKTKIICEYMLYIKCIKMILDVLLMTARYDFDQQWISNQNFNVFNQQNKY